MLPIGIARNIDFSLADLNSNPVPGRTLAVWQAAPNRLIFLRNQVACEDPLSLTDYGDGRYTLSYQPSSPGHDYLQIYDSATDLRVTDVEDIVPAGFALGESSVYTLDGAGALRVTLPGAQDYTVQVYLSSDWEGGRRSDADSMGASLVHPDGSWVSAIRVPSGTYHIVASKTGSQQVIKAYWGVG